MTFLGIILAEKSKKHTQKIQKNFLDNVLNIFLPQNPCFLGFELKKCPKHGQGNFFGFFECVFWIFQPKLSQKRSFLKNFSNFSAVRPPPKIRINTNILGGGRTAPIGAVRPPPKM